MLGKYSGAISLVAIVIALVSIFLVLNPTPVDTSADDHIFEFFESGVFDTTAPGEPPDMPLSHAGSPFTSADGVCFLAVSGGKMNGLAENVKVLLVNDVWTLRMSGSEVLGQARCIVY